MGPAVVNGRVDFKAVREQSSSSIELVLDRYLPGGDWVGSEYVVPNPTRGDANSGSFKINRSGVWSDFATGDKGGDLIDLVAYVTGKSKVEAGRELAMFLNVSPRQGSRTSYLFYRLICDSGPSSRENSYPATG
jgi:hypothetical protein